MKTNRPVSSSSSDDLPPRSSSSYDTGTHFHIAEAQYDRINTNDNIFSDHIKQLPLCNRIDF
jgi:hypothetical protein